MAEADQMAVTLLKRLSTLETQRQTWEDLWQDIADYVVPRKADITVNRSPGDKRTDRLFDATAVHAAELLSASLHGMLTNASTPWFSLRYRDPAFDADDTAKEWLEGATEVMYQAFARSNFQEQIHELYHDLITFGTGIMLVERDEEKKIRFSTRHISECFLSEDDQGRVDTVFRKFKISARAAYARWGSSVGQRIEKMAEKDPYEEVTLVHVVRPRDERDITQVDNMNMAYQSCYLNPDEKIVLSESGFDEMPYLCPRYLKSSFELGYGRSPASSALPDIKMLNKMSEVTIRAAQKQVDPPLMVPDDGFMLPIRTVPGGLNFYRSGTRDRLEPLQIGANNPLGLNMEEQRRDAIRQAFYVDQLIMGTGGQTMTATEVIQRTEEKMRLLGPVLGRLQAELLQPLIDRCFHLLQKQGEFPPTPEAWGDDITDATDVEYVSPLAKAQRTGDIQSVMRMFEMLMPLAQVDQSVLDYMDTDGMVKHLIRVLGVPATTVRGDQEVYQKRVERQQQQAEAQEMAQTTQAAEAAGAAAPMVKALNVGNIIEAGAVPQQAAE